MPVEQQLPPERYVGADRRGSAEGTGRGIGPLWLLAASVSLGATTLLIRLPAGTRTGGQFTAAIDDVDVGALAVATVVASLCWLLWRSTGSARMLWFGHAVAALAAGTASDLFGQHLGHEFVDAVRAACLLAGLIALGRAAWGPAVDTRSRFWRTGGFGVAATTAVVLQLHLLGWTTHSAAGARAVHLALAAASIAVGVGALRTGLRSRRPFAAWVALLVLVLAGSELAAGLWRGHADSWAFSPSAARLLAVVLAATTVATTVRATVTQQRRRLHRLHTEHRDLAAAREVEGRDRAHEARNALLSIEAATSTLECDQARLCDEQRDMLLSGITDEIARLQRLVAEVECPPAPEATLDVHDLVAQQVALAEARGELLELHCPPGVRATGRAGDVAEVVQNLLLNAARHAASEDPTEVHVVPDPTCHRILVSVEDRGPGVAEPDRERVFERGWRGGPTAGSGLGLPVSRRLARRLGGDLWVEGRHGGGARFVLALTTVTVRETASAPAALQLR